MHQQLQANMNYVTPSLSGKKRGLPVSASSQWPSSAVDGPEESQHASSIVDGLELLFGKLIYVLQLKCLELPTVILLDRRRRCWAVARMLILSDLVLHGS